MYLGNVLSKKILRGATVSKAIAATAHRDLVPDGWASGGTDMHDCKSDREGSAGFTWFGIALACTQPLQHKRQRHATPSQPECCAAGGDGRPRRPACISWQTGRFQMVFSRSISCSLYPARFDTGFKYTNIHLAPPLIGIDRNDLRPLRTMGGRAKARNRCLGHPSHVKQWNST